MSKEEQVAKWKLRVFFKPTYTLEDLYDAFAADGAQQERERVIAEVRLAMASWTEEAASFEKDSDDDVHYMLLGNANGVAAVMAELGYGEFGGLFKLPGEPVATTTK